MCLKKEVFVPALFGATRIFLDKDKKWSGTSQEKPKKKTKDF